MQKNPNWSSRDPGRCSGLPCRTAAPVTCVEQRASALGCKIERVLGKIVLPRRTGGRTSHVERGSVVQRLGESVGSEKRNPMTKSLSQTSFKRVVGGVSDARDQPTG